MKVICTLCKLFLAYHSSTTVMHKHLNRNMNLCAVDTLSASSHCSGIFSSKAASFASLKQNCVVMLSTVTGISICVKTSGDHKIQCHPDQTRVSKNQAFLFSFSSVTLSPPEHDCLLKLQPKQQMHCFDTSINYQHWTHYHLD